MSWTEERKAYVKEQWEAGVSARTIAADLHTTRNAICGVVHRNHWTSPNVIERKPKERKERPAARQVPYNIKLAKDRRTSPVPQPPMEPDQAPSIDDLSIPLDQRCTLMQLTDMTCRWPVGYPGTGDFFFCGAEPVEDRPYCLAHLLRAIQPRHDSRPVSLPKQSVRL